ncbi:hypothetical protein OQA88_9425 [Cercophora sp. LCS_1]
MVRGTICSVCKAIPFESLPNEEETAIPHRASLRELDAFSKGCELCLMLLLAVGDTCAAIKYKRDGNRDALPGGMASGMLMTFPSGKQVMTTSHPGNYMSGSNMYSPDGPNYNGPMWFDPLELFPGGEADGLRPWLFGNWWKSPDPELPLQLVGLGVRIGRTGKVEDGIGNTDEKVEFHGTQIRIRVRHNSQIRRLIPGRLRTGDTSAATVKALCREWMGSCDVKHNCAPPANAPLPTRVLDVSNVINNQVRLVTSSSVLAKPYVALSHCWGTSHRITTRCNNVAAHTDGIPIAHLPATFQHAVEMTRLLGISYLWIDSLCIIQDDPSDWEREASRMGDVYAHATVVIAADASTDDASGCYTTLDQRKTVTFVSSDNRALGRISYGNAAPLDVTNPPDTGVLNAIGMGNFTILHRPPQNDYLFFSQEWMPSSYDAAKRNTYQIDKMGSPFDPIATENLSTRGWTLQERLLATRTLHLTQGQMYWECCHHMLAEDGGIFPRLFPSWELITQYTAPGGSAETSPSWFKRGARIKHSSLTGWAGEIWLCLVEKYTARKLTNEKDKLPAISGLARRMAERIGDVYHAGLWKRDLLAGLAWRMFAYEPVHWCGDPKHDAEIAARTPPERDTALRPKVWRAPSWSWAAVDGRMEFQTLDADKMVAEVVDCQTTVAGGDGFGMVKEGFIKITGPLFEVVEGVLKTRPGDANHPIFKVPWKVAHASYDLSGGGYFDSGEKRFPCHVLFLDYRVVLLLQKRNDGKWERIGCGTVSAGDGLNMPCASIVMV